RPDDAIRIGFHELRVAHPAEKTQVSTITESLSISQAMVLESLDRHAILLYEIIDRLNKVFDIEGALREIAALMQRSLGVEKCEIFLPPQFKELTGRGFPTTYAERAIHQREAVFIPKLTLSITQDISESAGRLQIRSLLCVPAILNEQVMALIYLYNTSSKGRLLDKNDLHVAVAVAHLAALTIERVHMAEKLQDQEKIHQLLKRFLPPADAHAMLDGYLKTGNLPELSEQTATVLFADIADSTHLAEKLGPRRFGAILNRYYQDMTDIVFSHGGLIDKYLGDGVMAVFGLSSAQKDVERQAVEAGLQMLERLENNYADESNPIIVGVAVNTGPVMAGYVVTQERVELSVLGDTVNVASRMEALARPNRLFVGPLTYQAIQGNFEMRSIGPVEIRGRTEPVQVHEVVRSP
ncbi:MAG: GAF domain-containing protein, partial [Anaerolineales bacterium]|nr:GAF domain-containing protein [Anaerolineales bacterium]